MGLYVVQCTRTMVRDGISVWRGAGEKSSLYRLAVNTTDGPPTVSHMTPLQFCSGWVKLITRQYNIHIRAYIKKAKGILLYLLRIIMFHDFLIVWYFICYGDYKHYKVN